MSAVGVSAIVFACVFGGALLGLSLRAALPQHHLGTDIDALGPALENERAETDKTEALKNKLIERAEMIRSRWKEAPAPPPEVLAQGTGDDGGDDEGDEETDEAGQALEAA